MKIEAADAAGGAELTITIVTSKASAALATLAEHLAPLVASIAVQIVPVERDESGVPAELVDPDVDVVGLPSPEDDVDAPAEPDIDDPTYDPTRAEADELIAAGLSAHHIARALDVPLETVRGWQKENR